MTLSKIFTVTHARIVDPLGNVKLATELFLACTEELGYSNAQAFRLWRKWHIATGRKYF